MGLGEAQQILPPTEQTTVCSVFAPFRAVGMLKKFTLNVNNYLITLFDIEILLNIWYNNYI